MSSAKTATIEIPPTVFGPVLAVRAIDEHVIRNTQPHQHRCGQLFGTMRGLVAVVVGERHWIVPAGRSVWIPADCIHSLQSYGPLQSWSIYLDEEACQRLPGDPGTMQTTALLNEAACRAARWETSEITEEQKRIALVILDEIYSLRHDAIGLPMPKDSRALRVANALAINLSDNKSISEWAHWTGSSAKTLSRHFIDETGMTFGQWRQQARVLRALELLTSELPVTTIALELGYETTSAFVAMFKRWRGVAPGRFRKTTDR
jgi:AraC-like DNA-binding protein/mannose-6-phosphate isomerase-like protein (cupin superfamily)